MAWPTRALTSEGFKEYKSPLENLRGKAPEPEWGTSEFEKEHGKWRNLDISYKPKADWTKPDDMWYSKWRDKNKEEDEEASVSGISYWTIKNNPLFEHAAGKLNIDWKSFTELYTDIEAYEGLKTQAAVSWPQNYSPLDEMTAEQEFEWKKEQKGTGLLEYEEYYDSAGNPIRQEKPYRTRYGLDERVTGSDTAMHDIYRMNEWINNTVKKWDDPDAPIIEEGPTAKQYGLPEDTDPWEFYGLDKVPRIIPKVLDVNYEESLLPPEPSSASYRTPKGYTRIDLDSVETAEIGDAFWDYKEKFDFAQEHGFWDFDLGNTGDDAYQKELKSIFGDEVEDIRIFGQRDFDNLIEQGLDKEEIRDIINARLKSGQKLIMGPEIAKHMDMYSYDPRWWKGKKDTLGEKGVKLLKLQGLDDAGIMSRYAKGKHKDNIDELVQKNFGIRIEEKTGMYDFYFMDPSDKKAFGMKDYNQLSDQGLDTNRIKQIATELVSTGWTLGPEAAEKLGLKDYQPQYQKAMQDGHLGGQVVDALRTQGKSIEDVRAYGENPEVLTIGRDAAEKLYGWKDEGKIGNFGMEDLRDIEKNWPNNNEPSKVIIAKIAAGNAEAIGPKAVDYIWGNEVYDVHMKPPVGADPSHFTFGMDTINYLRDHPTNPVTNNKTLAAIAKGAHWVGEAAAKELGIPANKPPIEKKTLKQVLSTPMLEYDKPDLSTGEYGGFGQQEIDWMETAKWTSDQMRAVTDKFDRIGPEAAKYLWGAQLTAHMQAPANAVDPSKTTFGKETIQYLDRIDPQISDKSLAAIARGAADYVGKWALDYFEEKDIIIGKGSAPLSK